VAIRPSELWGPHLRGGTLSSYSSASPPRYRASLQGLG